MANPNLKIPVTVNINTSKWAEFKNLLKRLDSPDEFSHLVIYFDETGRLESGSGETLWSFRSLRQMLKKLRKLGKKVKPEPELPICTDCGMPVKAEESLQLSDGISHDTWGHCVDALQKHIEEQDKYIQELEEESEKL